MRILFWVIPSVKFQLGKTNYSNSHYLSFLSFIDNNYPEEWFSNNCFNIVCDISFKSYTNNIVKLHFNGLIQLQNLSELFGNLIYLTYIKLIFNCLQYLPESFRNLLSIEELYISLNELNIILNSFNNLLYIPQLNILMTKDQLKNLSINSNDLIIIAIFYHITNL